MGILRELFHDLTFGLVDRTDEDAEPFRCVKCGVGLDRNHRSCPECGSEFVAPVDGNATEGDDDPGPPGPGPGR
jgi:predicted amidophosphoribosyltransferase